jgi:hypothetical protein
MKTAAVVKALVCVYTAITEGLPAEHRRNVDHILRDAIDSGEINDAETMQVLKYMIDDEDRPRAD